MSETEILNIRADAPGSERSHGYTQTPEWTWYWVYDHNDEELSFRDGGTPTGQPEEPPADVRAATEHWVDEHEIQGGGLQ